LNPYEQATEGHDPLDQAVAEATVQARCTAPNAASRLAGAAAAARGL